MGQDHAIRAGVCLVCLVLLRFVLIGCAVHPDTRAGRRGPGRDPPAVAIVALD